MSVETTDGREIGRLSFAVALAGENPNRMLVRETY